ELATTKSAPGKPVILDSRGFIINGELSTAIISDPDALTILTDLFDGKNDNPDWANTLKGSGKEQLKDPYITCLFGSSPAHFYEKIPQANIEGGYIGRNLIIYEENRSKLLDPLGDSDKEEESDDAFASYLASKYLPHLIAIQERPKTRLGYDEKAKIYYNQWRRNWKENQKSYNDKTGFINRVPDHVMKVAMCLSLSRFDFNGLITECDFKEAVNKVTSLVYNSQQATAGSGIDPQAQQIKKVIDYLLAAKDNELKRAEILVLGYGNFDLIALDRVIETLLEMGWIKRERYNKGKESDWLIKLSGEPLERLMTYRKQREKK
ncbi:MAG: hypothetical protein ACRD9Q_00495, partial [Nitrososphaeraceae archaeon]